MGIYVPITDKQLNLIKKVYSRYEDEKRLLDEFKVERLSQLSKQQASEILAACFGKNEYKNGQWIRSNEQ